MPKQTRHERMKNNLEIPHAWAAAYTPFRCRWRLCEYTFAAIQKLKLPEQNALASSVVVDCTSELPRIARVLPLSPWLNAKGNAVYILRYSFGRLLTRIRPLSG